jgi:hypothetical protein
MKHPRKIEAYHTNRKEKGKKEPFLSNNFSSNLHFVQETKLRPELENLKSAIKKNRLPSRVSVDGSAQMAQNPNIAPDGHARILHSDAVN